MTVSMKSDTGRNRLSGKIVRLARRRPLLTFYVITLLVSWPLGLLPFGPSLAALIAAALIGGRSEVKALLRRVAIWRVGVSWYAVALFGPILLVAVAAAINVALGATMPGGSQLSEWTGFGALLLLQLAFGGPWEELGWRGFALPHLLDRWSALAASLILGCLWTVWHIPLFLGGTVPWADAAVVLAVSIPFTAVFLKTRGSVLIAFLMHGSLNAAAGVVIPMFEGADRTRMYWSMAIVAALLSVAIVMMGRRVWLSRSERTDPAALVASTTVARVASD
ncbi:MAG: type II CAAX endopeptidase family protein [Acidimicrobiia bacterium]